jgi:hypothetical protein
MYDLIQRSLHHELKMELPSMWHPLQWQSALHKTSTPSSHCSLANDLVCGSFPDHVANLWEWLAQSYIKLNACSLFKWWHPGVQNSDNNKISEPDRFWWLSYADWMCKQLQISVCLHTSVHAQTWKFTQILCHSAAVQNIHRLLDSTTHTFLKLHTNSKNTYYYNKRINLSSHSPNLWRCNFVPTCYSITNQQLLAAAFYSFI